MAAEIEKKLEKSAAAAAEEEKKIPVFTVLKNNSILKNIFLIDSPPDPLLLPPSTSTKEEGKKEELLEEILVVGRHPDCNITLEHPSISRFHLRIHSIPSLQSLSIFDLSSGILFFIVIIFFLLNFCDFGPFFMGFPDVGS